MTPAHIRALRAQLGETQAGFAARLRDVDPLLSPNRHTVSRWEREDGPTPNPHAIAAMNQIQITLAPQERVNDDR